MADEVLVVVSKLKKYIKESADMNTSIENAKADGRKTIMDRDFQS